MSADSRIAYVSFPSVLSRRTKKKKEEKRAENYVMVITDLFKCFSLCVDEVLKNASKSQLVFERQI